MKSITDSLNSRSKDYFDFVDQMRSSANELESVKEMANLASRRDHLKDFLCFLLI